ncbi:uncharacterized protein LOC105178276 isoform X1 [Sesamum indicum]|uniref:Uncharacterized protein LOC105178276 isoform X1 n=1 Tax=Sesamum indicum TaxID=4182 RepID=A0A6I9UFA4_SESIN|nr:uncharacterized protein LOC105178276 isoform X1 [Sesamum indicum]
MHSKGEGINCRNFLAISSMMSTQTTNSSSSYHLISYHGKGCKKEETITSNVVSTMIKSELKIDRARCFLAFRPKYGIFIYRPCYRGIPKSGNFKIKASASPNNPPSSWQKWLLGLLLTVILPALGYKGGLFLNLKSKIDKAIETVEHVTEVVEEVAEEAEKIVEEVEEKLPGDSQIKEALESLDDLAKKAVLEAKNAQDVVHKVKDAEQQMEETMIKNGKAQAKK